MSSTTTMTTEVALPLTEEMRKATRKAHSLSANLVNLKLVVALTNKTVYGQSVLLFYYIYAQLEQSLQAQKNHEKLKDVIKAAEPLSRGDAFVQDINFYLEEGWDKKYTAPPAVVAYVNRIKEVEKEDPILLIAYTYHLYMTLLAGGTAIQKMVKTTLGLQDEAGNRIFEFGTKNKMALRNSFKDVVNAVPIDAETKKRLVAESTRIFELNNNVVRGIEGMGRQFALWVLKWIIVLQLIYWTYVLFIQGKPAI